MTTTEGNTIKISIIGTGFVAVSLAEAWAKSGHAVILGSRTPEALSGELPFAVESLENAVRVGDVIVNGTPGAHSVGALTSIPSEFFSGKVLLDVASAYTPDYALCYPDSSLAEAIQEALPLAKVVKSLNTADMAVMTKPASIGRSSVFVSGNDAEAKNTVKGLITDLGWSDEEIVDLGGIESAQATERYLHLFLELRRFTGGPLFNILLVR